MALSTDARQELALLLRDAGLPAFAQMPQTVTLPAVVLVPDSPYLTPTRVGPQLAYQMGLRILVLGQAADNAAGLALIEQLLDDTLSALPGSVLVTRIDPPTLDTLGAQGSAYGSEITAQLHLEGGSQ